MAVKVMGRDRIKSLPVHGARTALAKPPMSRVLGIHMAFDRLRRIASKGPNSGSNEIMFSVNVQTTHAVCYSR
jgi:hypothetical protein